MAPGLLGSQEAIRQSQSKEKREEHRARRCNLIATCVKSSSRSREINGRPVILRDNKLWIDTGNDEDISSSHQYAGYYLPYPDTKYEGLVTTITDVAPIMNWVYIDKDTCEVKYGVRADAQPNLTGPFDCTRQDRRLTFDGWEGFCAVEESSGCWALYFDVDDDGLKSKVPLGMRVLELELSRKEKKFRKEVGERQMDQTTKRSVRMEEEELVDMPLEAEEVVTKPGVVGEQDGAGDDEPEPLRSLKIPVSIFENPPPMVEPLAFRPRTPPPAYSPSPVAEDDIPITVPSTPPQATSRATTTISPTPFGKPLVTSTSTTEKRTTPKLNRSSGTRALAQAQKFEALAAGQTLSQDNSGKIAQRISRASSSEYSVDEEDPLIATERSKNRGLSKSPERRSRSRPGREPTKGPVMTQSKALQALDSLLESADQPTHTPPAAEVRQQQRPARPRSSTDPAISSARASKPSVSRTSTRGSASTRSPSVPMRPVAARSLSRTTTQRTRTNTGTITDSKMKVATAATTVDQTRLQQISAQTRSPSSRQVAIPPGTSEIPARKSLARTMTTGQKNQGMANRIGDQRGRSGSSVSISSSSGRAGSVRGRSEGIGGVGRKTTSTLFREIDALVGGKGEESKR